MNGEAYRGFFLNNKFHSKGVFTFSKTDPQDRKHYIGQFKEGQFHGDGEITLMSGDSYKATWEDNKVITP